MKVLMGLLLVANVIFAAVNIAHGSYVIGGMNIAAVIVLVLSILEME
jgi:hypothetical protein